MSVRKSVCLSCAVLNGYTCPQMSSKVFSPSGNPTVVVFPYQTGWRYSNGDPLTGASNARGYKKNHDFRPVSCFISQMMQDRAIVPMEGEYETAPKLSNGTGLNDLGWSLTQISRSGYSTSNNSKTVQDRAIINNGGLIESRMWSIEQHHFLWPWTSPNPVFKVTLFFDTEYLVNG